MPGRTLPTILSKDVASRNTEESCYVTIGTNVYDITPFLDAHPGGADLILEYGGKDVSSIMKDEISHTHSESAYEMLDEHLIGFVVTEPVLKTVTQSTQPQEILPLPPTEAGREELDANGAAGDDVPEQRLVYRATGMSSEADLKRETNIDEDYRTHKFLNLEKPLLMQVWRGGFSREFYLEQVHRPRQYKGGASAPLFGNFLEPLSKTPWWMVPTVWLPPVVYFSFLASQQLPIMQFASYWLSGVVLWTLVEYGMHRGLFHVDKWVSIGLPPVPSRSSR